MKKIFSVFLCAVMLLTILAGCTGGPEGPESTTASGAGSFRAGFGRADITPELGIGLAGMGDDATRLAEYIRDRLYLTCVAITDEADNTLLLFSCDNIRTEPRVSDNIRTIIARQSGIPKENILFSSTHSHNTPDSGNSQYTSIVTLAATEAANAALADRSTAEMYIGNAYSEGLNFVRHYLMSDGSYAGDNYGDPTGKTYVSHETEVDNQIQLIRFTRASGKDIVMMNWRAHPILMGGSYRDISSGYIGPCREAMESALDCNFIYFQGCSGNVKDTSYMPDENFSTYQDQGFKLADYACEAMGDLKKVNTGLIEVKVVSYKGNIRIDPAELLEACDVFDSVIANGGSTYDGYRATNGMVNSKWTRKGAENRRQLYLTGGGKFNLDLYAVSIGDVAFLGSPNELFDNTGMQIKDASPYEQTFILCYCNGRGNYVPSEPAYTNGCYEKDQGYFVKGTAEELVSVYTSMLQELKADTPIANPSDVFDSQLPNG